MKKIFKIKEINIPYAIILGSLIIGASVFLTTWVFFGGDGNRQKLFIENPTTARPTSSQNQMTPEQIKKIQEQRAEQMKRATEAKTASTTSN